MRRFFLVLASLIAAALVAFFFAVMPVVDGRMNRVVAVPHPPISPQGQALHRTLLVADLHADELLWPRSILERSSRGHVDLPRLIEGRIGLQVLSAVTQVPRGLNYERNDSTTDLVRLIAPASRWPMRTWTHRVERALFLAEKLDRAVARSGGRLVPILSAADLTAFLAARARQPDRVAVLLSIEGAHAADGAIANLDRLYDAGFRMVGLTHFFDNQVGGSSAGVTKGGLTSFGARAVEWMERRRVIVDLAHASPQLIDDVLDRATRPVVVSHTGVSGTCPGPRNLTDHALDRLAANGGLVGIGFWDAAVCGTSPDAIAAAIRYAASRIGVDHVALGSDFDGATTTAFDASGLALVTDALLRAGFAPDEIRRIMGGNVIRFLLENLPPG